MTFELKAPLFVFPQFGSEESVSLARQIGLHVGPFARANAAKPKDAPLYLMSAPEGWSEIKDLFGIYLADPLGRRRIYSSTNDGTGRLSYSYILPRLNIQEWWVGGATNRYYVRRTMGGEENIFHHPHCTGNDGILFEQDYESGAEGVTGRQACETWLQNHYPDWKSPLAYWD